MTLQSSSAPVRDRLWCLTKLEACDAPQDCFKCDSHFQHDSQQFISSNCITMLMSKWLYLCNYTTGICEIKKNYVKPKARKFNICWMKSLTHELAFPVDMSSEPWGKYRKVSCQPQWIHTEACLYYLFIARSQKFVILSERTVF